MLGVKTILETVEATLLALASQQGQHLCSDQLYQTE